MPAGRLRHLVRLERPAKQNDGYGNVENGWQEIQTLSAEIKPMRGSETVEAGKLEGRLAYEILIRWNATLGDGRLSNADRAVNARTGEVYNIRTVENRDMKRQWLTITAEAGVA
jgi:SPP1 family predicted phage head-tail adaptor